MPVIRTFASHASADKPRVREILEQAAPLGVRPWIDEHDLMGSAGMSLEGAIMPAIGDPSCRSLTLFLTEKAAQSAWVHNEVGKALALLPKGFRVIPIALDPIDKVTLPAAIKTALRTRGTTFDTLYIRPDDPQSLHRFAAAVLQAGGLEDATEIVLHLGHRVEQWLADVPEEWAALPVIDLRFRYPHGHRDFSPTSAEWSAIRDGIEFLKTRLMRAQQINICGAAPLGVAAAVGRTWDRGTGTRLQGWNTRNRQIWSAQLSAADEARAQAWTPEAGHHVKEVSRKGNFFGDHDTIAVAFVNRDDYDPVIKEWHDALNPARPFIMFRTPLSLSSGVEATELLTECLGAIRWLRRSYATFQIIDLILCLPMPSVAFLVHHLRQSGTIRLHDKVQQRGAERYRLALSWP